MTLLQVATLWPHLAASAEQVGARSFLAVPLHTGEGCLGVLNLYSADTTVPEPDADLMMVLTEYAGRGLTDYQNSRPNPTAEEALRRVLADWSTIEQAIGVLMAVHGFDVDYANQVLYDQAQDWGRTVADHAAHVITDHAPPN